MERELTLMRSCWAFFDDVRRRVSAEMQKGPRGAGRDRDRIVRHTLFTEQDWAKMLGVAMPQDQEEILTDEGLNKHRDAYCNAIRELHSQNKMWGVVSPTDVWAAGYYWPNNGSPFATLIEHYSDPCATPAPTLTPIPITPTLTITATATAMCRCPRIITPSMTACPP